MRTTPLDPKLIVVPEERQSADDDTVRALMVSMEEVGLIHPIVVQRRQQNQRPYIVSGLHRVQAAIRLRWESIDAIELPPICDDDATAEKGRLTEIAENLHRREISEIERAELVAEWVKIVDERKPAQLGQVSEPPQGGRGKRAGQSEIARNLGMTRQTVERSLKVAALSPEAKEAAKRYDLDTNQKALLEAAKHDEPKAQVQALKERVKPTAPFAKKGEPRGYEQLRAAWAMASENARERFKAEVLVSDRGGE